jgi:hypothetical protein
VLKNFCAGFGGPNRSRPPSGASPIFSSVRPSMPPTAHSWSLCGVHLQALRGTCHESFIVGIPCTPMRGSKASRACSRRQEPGPEDTETWRTSSPWST